jgi:hypothetical protein
MILHLDLNFSSTKLQMKKKAYGWTSKVISSLAK